MFVQDGIDFTKPAPLFLKSVVIHGGPSLDARGGCESYFMIFSKSNGVEYTSPNKLRIGGNKEKFTFDVGITVDKDVKLQWYRDDPKEKKEKLKRVFHVWFNTHFAKEPTLVFTLANGDIDGIKKIKTKVREQCFCARIRVCVRVCVCVHLTLCAVPRQLRGGVCVWTARVKALRRLWVAASASAHHGQLQRLARAVPQRPHSHVR